VIYYLCKDHLGSITGIMEPDGDILEEYSFDAWGIRRNPADWSYSNVSAPTYTQHGFTGHEHLDMFSLIHMNGRIYDPEISRFLSPDPVIQYPYNLLNYNRYTYCFNNPLKYTDLSGFIVQAEDPPEMQVLNPGWLKYVPYGVYSGLYNDYEIGSTGGGGGNIVEIEGVYWDKDAKAYRNKKDGHLLSEAKYLAYINLLLNEATNQGGDYMVYDWTASEGTFKTTGTLSWYNGNGDVIGSWSANSGSTNLLSIPSGVYSLSNVRLRNDIRMKRDGVGFSVDITPNPIWGRTDLRIHPDGNRYGNWQVNDGTAGCIGLTCGANGLNQFYNMISNRLSGGQTMPLYVTGNMINMGEIEIFP